jgi:hypothetical protein
MEKNPVHLQEIHFGSSDQKESRQIAAYLRDGLIKKIAPKIYTSNLRESAETIIRRNWFRIIAEQYPGSLLSHRSALECKPTPDGHIYISYTYTKNIQLPGLTIHFQEGHKPLQDDRSFFGGLFISQEARAYLENFQVSRKSGELSKTLTQEELENRLESVIRSRGEDALNTIRDKAKAIAPDLGMGKELTLLNRMISAMLSTQPAKILSSDLARARALGEPFDPTRVKLFESLYNELAGNEYPYYEDKNEEITAYQNFAFFESYFSNYIEGTVFEVAEARQIILSETPIPARNEDSHDVLGTYKLVSNEKEMQTSPSTPEELLNILRYRHAILMAGRPNKNPGIFKHINNRAGNTEFVDHTLVNGTLKKGYELYSLLQHPFAKSAYIMFLISEIHPFLDGNGRIARIMMNAELATKKLSKIIIPTVYREDYMGALRVLTRQGNPSPYIRMLLRAYEFSATIYGEDFNAIENYLRSCDAFNEPAEGKLIFK